MAESKGRRGARARALIVERNSWLPSRAGDELRQSLLEDLRELVSALGLAADGPKTGARGPEIRALLEAAGGTHLVLFSDVAALPPLSVEGALDSLRQYPCVLGPCADGGLYLLGFGPEMPERARVALVEAATVSPNEAMNIAADVLCDDEINCGLLPPWFRIADERGLRFAQSLARLSILSDEGEEDFVCDRLRLWFEHNEP